MSEQLRRAMAAGRPGRGIGNPPPADHRGVEAALADSSMRFLLYAGLATATADRRGLAGGNEDWRLFTDERCRGSAIVD